MRIVAIEEHVLPQDLGVGLGPAARSFAGVGELLDDVGERRLADMDAAGVDVQVLSFLGHSVQEMEPADAVGAARAANDHLAASVAAHPDRFAAFATLPLADPEASAAELHRAVGELGFVGTMIHGQTRGRFLDDPAFSPVLSAAEELGVPIYLHPAEPPETVARAYFSGLPDAASRLLMTAGWGWHAETGMHVLRLAVSGTFDVHPRLRLIVGHMGENLPFSLARADERLTPVTAGERPVAQTVLDHVLITTAGYTTAPPLACALAVFGAERILFSVDYPFSDNASATAFLTGADLGDADRERIAHGNADTLLGLSR